MLVHAIVQLALAMGIRVVAEGVETEPQRAELHRMGCHMLQGYLISRPQPAGGFEQFARQLAHTALADRVGLDASLAD